MAKHSLNHTLKHSLNGTYRSIGIALCLVTAVLIVSYGLSARAGNEPAVPGSRSSSLAADASNLNRAEATHASGPAAGHLGSVARAESAVAVAAQNHSSPPEPSHPHATVQLPRAPRGTSAAHAQSLDIPDSGQIIVRRPQGPLSVEIARPDPLGRVGRVACSTCHSTRKPDFENQDATRLDEFHQGMTLTHGQLSCYSCHSPDHPDQLRLADGRSVERADVMQLCAQCHGKKAIDFEHGIHGGMTGYWDLRRGGRLRNNCIDCHDPHGPKFPMMQPTFKTLERFAKPSTHEHDDSHTTPGNLLTPSFHNE